MEKTGLILEGGGMRGLYTIGVLDYFMDHDLYLPYVVGVSAGACNGCSYVSRQRGRNYKINIGYIRDPRYLSLRSLIKTGSLFGMDFIFKDMPHHLVPLDYDTFYNSDTVFSKLGDLFDRYKDGADTDDAGAFRVMAAFAILTVILAGATTILAGITKVLGWKLFKFLLVIVSIVCAVSGVVSIITSFTYCDSLVNLGIEGWFEAGTKASPAIGAWLTAIGGTLAGLGGIAAAVKG